MCRKWIVGCGMLIVLMLPVWQPCSAAPPVSVEVGTNAVKILPERNLSLSYGTAWAEEAAVAQGDILRWSNQHYMAVTGGTLGTNAPDTTATGIQTNGTVVLSYVEKGPRLGFVLQLQDAGSVRINLNSPAVPGIGIQIEGEKSLWQESDRGSPQGAVWAVSDAGSNTVSALEW